MTIYGIHAYITLMNWSQFYITLCYSYYVRIRIRHNYPSLIHCLRAFHILFFAYLLFRCYCNNYYKNPKTFIFTFGTITIIIIPLLLLNTLLKILSYPGVVELITQLLILGNILWLPLCRINKFGLNTLPSKTFAIPYTCGLSMGIQDGYNKNFHIKCIKYQEKFDT